MSLDKATKAERSVPRTRAAKERENAPPPELPSEQGPARVGRVGTLLVW